MRVYRRPEFLKLPAGTIFNKGAEWYFGCLSVKGDSIEFDDFYCCDLDWVDAQRSEQAFERLGLMLKDGASFPVQNSECRDGLFDDNAIFLVWERADLEFLKELAAKAIAVLQGAL